MIASLRPAFHPVYIVRIALISASSVEVLSTCIGMSEASPRPQGGKLAGMAIESSSIRKIEAELLTLSTCEARYGRRGAYRSGKAG